MNAYALELGEVLVKHHFLATDKENLALNSVDGNECFFRHNRYLYS